MSQNTAHDGSKAQTQEGEQKGREAWVEPLSQTGPLNILKSYPAPRSWKKIPELWGILFPKYKYSTYRKIPKVFRLGQVKPSIVDHYPNICYTFPHFFLFYTSFIGPRYKRATIWGITFKTASKTFGGRASRKPSGAAYMECLQFNVYSRMSFAVDVYRILKLVLNYTKPKPPLTYSQILFSHFFCSPGVSIQVYTVSQRSSRKLGKTDESGPVTDAKSTCPSTGGSLQESNRNEIH